jgi:hypothetical protein
VPYRRIKYLPTIRKIPDSLTINNGNSLSSLDISNSPFRLYSLPSLIDGKSKEVYVAIGKEKSANKNTKL